MGPLCWGKNELSCCDCDNARCCENGDENDHCLISDGGCSSVIGRNSRDALEVMAVAGNGRVLGVVVAGDALDGIHFEDGGLVVGVVTVPGLTAVSSALSGGLPLFL